MPRHGRLKASGPGRCGEETPTPGGRLPPPVPQLETMGAAPLEPPRPVPPAAGGTGAPKAGGDRPEEHPAFAPYGRVASPDRLRELPTSLRRTPVAAELAANRSFLRQALGESWDVVYRDLTVGQHDRRALLVYIDGLADKPAISRFVIEALTLGARTAGVAQRLDGAGALEEIQARVIGIGEVRLTGDLAEAIDRLCSGESALLLEGAEAALIIDTRGWKDRGVEEPDTEVSIRGPRDGFNETVKTSTALLRRRLRTPLLRLERAMIGDYTRTDIVLAYIEGLVGRGTLSEVRRRLNRIVIDGILESEYIEELIQDDPVTPFPLMLATEYPGRVAAALLEGRVAILTDTTPFALVCPATFVETLQTAEDYFQKPYLATFVRALRLVCLVVSVFGAAFYVAATTYQSEILPTQLLERLVLAKRGVPFGSAVEVLILEAAFEVLREAGLRLPRAIGQAVSIVGALVLGEAAVSGGLVSPAVVIVVALSAVSSLALPSYFLALGMRLLRFPLILLAAATGMLGLSMGALVVLGHLVSLRSFGVPYMAPAAPFSAAEWGRDVLLRAPWWAMNRRPRLYGAQHLRREGPGLRPGPGQPNEPARDGGP